MSRPNTTNNHSTHLIEKWLSVELGLPGSLGQNLRIGIGHHEDSDLHSNPYDPKRLRSVLGGVVHKSIEGNIPALPKSFELSSPAEKYERFYKH
ncbi:hypothetical protein TNCV_16291 [Trichonephila clavipes]|nr:hypothetical protein TNCV_16291 [Trichonephila clavipes]